MDKKLHQEIVREEASAVSLVSRHFEDDTIPIPSGMYMNQVQRIRAILDDTSWEVITATNDYIYFRRYVEDES